MKEMIIELQSPSLLGSREAIAAKLGVSRWSIDNWVASENPPAQAVAAMTLLWERETGKWAKTA